MMPLMELTLPPRNRSGSRACIALTSATAIILALRSAVATCAAIQDLLTFRCCHR